MKTHKRHNKQKEGFKCVWLSAKMKLYKFMAQHRGKGL
jgi:hypothetical protein